MSDQLPTGDFSPGFDDPSPRRGLDGRAVRALLAGAAGVAVLGAFTGGYLWVSSNPGVADAGAVAPGVPSGDTPTGIATASSGSFAFGGKDVFDDSFLPSDDAGASSAAAGTSGVSTSSGSSVASTTKSSSVGSTAAGSTSSSTKTPSSGTTSSPSQSPTSIPSTASTPAPSTAAPWVQGSVTFDEMVTGTSSGKFIIGAGGLNPVKYTLAAGTILPSTSTVFRPQGTTTERPMSDAEIKACAAFVKSASAADAEQRNRETENCTVVVDFVYVPVLVPTSQTGVAAGSEAFGWVAADDASLPDAALGKVSGTLRWVGTRGDSYAIQIGNSSPQWLEEGDEVVGATVGGVTLKFESTSIDSIGRTGIAVFSDGKNKYFTILGGGEGSGVTF